MNQSKTSIIEDVEVTYLSRGLTSKEVKQRTKEYGENTFTRKKVTAIVTFCKQFINPISFILIFAAVLSAFMDDASGAIIIMTIVILNSFLSFAQEYRSEKAVEKLSELIKREVLVIRDNKQMMIDVCYLVPGDTIILRGGDVVPADVKIFESSNLSVNESQLTGETLPVNKTAKGELQETLLFSGSIIETGHCQGVVYATGDQSQLGKIASLSKNTEVVSPYQKAISEFSILILRIIGATIVFMLAAKFFSIHGISDLAEVILFTVALAMSVVPEALPMIITINLSYGALRLSKKKVIVKRLSATEDLGRVNILCTDKTGTLTEDCLTITKVITEDEKLFQKIAYATIEDLAVENKKHHSSFDRAFLEYVPTDVQEITKDWIPLDMLPFDPTARRRRTIIKDSNENKHYLVVIGAIETLLDLCHNKDQTDYKEAIIEAGNSGMRQLAIAYKEIEYHKDFDILANETDLYFLGFANLMDPLRKTAKASIEEAKKLGIKVKILTGDSLEVATHIGKEVGLINTNDPVYSGDELENMSPQEREKAITDCSVFARVTPEQKYKIIELLKVNNIVGYQGDGINDAPSLKLADVAVAVHNATDVAKDSADIILLEDDLSVIMNGIRYGRSIFVNINKYIKHAMIGNIGTFFALIFFYVAFSADLPMLAIQLLIANLIQDMPLMSVFSDSVDAEEVESPQLASGVKQLVKTSLILGAFTAVYYLAYLGFIGTAATALTRTNLFLFFNFTQLLIVISVRTKRFFWQGTKPSALLLTTILFFIFVSIALVYIPITASWMGFAFLPLKDFVILSVVSIAYIFLLDVAKIVLRRK